MTNLMPRPVLVGSRSHGEPFNAETFCIARRADPPTASGGVGTSADESAISNGGVAGGFTLRDGEDSAWGLVCGIEQFSPDDLQTQADCMNERPELRSSALLAALCRAQAVLAQTPVDADPAALVGIPAGDLLTMVTALMQRLR